MTRHHKQTALERTISAMTFRQLKKELSAIRRHMTYAGVGRFELVYEDLLMRELEARGQDADYSSH